MRLVTKSLRELRKSVSPLLVSAPMRDPVDEIRSVHQAKYLGMLQGRAGGNFMLQKKLQHAMRCCTTRHDTRQGRAHCGRNQHRTEHIAARRNTRQNTLRQESTQDRTHCGKTQHKTEHIAARRNTRQNTLRQDATQDTIWHDTRQHDTMPQDTT